MVDVKQVLKDAGALMEGHFLLSSGRHSDRYCQCAKLFEQPNAAREVVSSVADKIKEAGVKVDLIVGPAMGGIIAAYELSAQLGIRNIFTERVDNQMAIRRGFSVASGERVIIMEDVITTGGSSLEVAKILKEQGAEVIALACIVDRSVVELKYPVFSAIKLAIDTFDRQDCPMCKDGSPAVKPGSRKM